MNTLQVLTIGKPVTRQHREETLKNHANYLGSLVNKSLSLQQYQLINKKINEIKDKLTNPNTKIMENKVTFEQVIVDDATFDNDLYFLDLSKEKKVIERNDNVGADNTNEPNEQYLNSLFDGITVQFTCV